MAGIRADVNLNVNTTQAKRSMDRAAAEINKVVNGIGGKQVSFSVNSRSFTQPLGRINASANEFTKSLEASNARVIAFGASVGIINGISDAFKGLVVETVKFEKTLTDINVVLNASAQSLERFGQGLFDVAKNTAQSFNVSAEAALEFSRQGLTMEEVLSRTNDALTLTRLTGLKAAEAVSGLTAAVNAFGSAGLTTTDIIDKLAAVDVKFAVSSEDLINALERTGAVAIDAGVEIDSLIGLVTALQQTTARGGAVIGNGLKTIFTRIQRPESIRQLEEMGLAVRDLTGAILPADRLMLGMAKSFDKLTQSQQSNIVQFSAGIFQANVFRAALRDLAKEQSIQAQATEIAGNASGDAAKKNEILNQTMSAMASQTATSLQELAETIGKLTLTPEIGGLLSFLQDGIEGIQNMLGGGEEKGSDFAKGLVRGIGNVLTGPAAVAFGAIFIKLFVNISKFASSSLKDVLGIVSEKDKIKQMEESITKALSENLKIQEGLNNLEGDRKAQEQFILGIIEKQNQAMAEQAQLASRLARPLVQAGINPDFSKSRKGGNTGSSGVIPESAREEVRGAAKGGYRAGKVDSMNIPGMGEVVYNKAEKVKRFPGMRQPAIMPPEQSRAGRTYKDAFAGQHGFDPYASGGFIPNYALEAKKIGNTNILQLPKAKMFVETTDQDRVAGGFMKEKMKGWRSIETPIRSLKKEMPSYSKHLSALEALGFDILKRSFYFSNVDSKHKAGRSAFRAGQKDPKRVSYATGKGYEQALSKSKMMKSKGYEWTQEAHDAKIDFISKRKMPLEAKYGSSQKDNLMSKSIRLSGDKYIEEFLAKKGMGEIGSSFSKQKLEDSKEILRRMELGSSDADVQAYGLFGGLIPNFSNSKLSPVKSIANIIDGDSIEADILVGTQRVDHRLQGVDAVEKDQAYGTRATTIARNFYNNDKKGRLRLRDNRVQGGRAAYGRGLFRDQDLARVLVEKGYGVPDAGYLNKSEYSEYKQITEKAKRKGVGIWRNQKEGEYEHPKAKFYLHQQGIIQGAKKWKDVTVGKTRFKKDGVNLSNEKSPGYADGGKKIRHFGLIPNFIDKRTRQQKIQDALRDPANKGIKFKGGNLGTMSIKSKNMFHQMFLESYVNKGLKSDYDMLVKMGYDPKKITAARKHKQKGGIVKVMSDGLVPNFAANWKRFKKFDKNQYLKSLKKGKSNNEQAKIDAYVKAAGGAQKFQRLNEKFGLDKVDDIFQILGFAKGYVPNFANPLGDAVSREKAAGVPSSKIRIERSNELKSSQNPMGLAVTNTRDEPMGVSQGIKRAKSMGIDPKKHGASSGLVPNFVDPRSERLSQSGSKTKVSFKELGKAADKAADSMEKNSMQSMMSLQRLFLFQSGISMANGFLEQFAAEGGKAAKTFAELGMAVTSITGAYIQQKTVVSELMESFDVGRDKAVGLFDLGSRKSKAGRGQIGKGLGKAFEGGKGFSGFMSGIKMAGKGLLRFTPIVGQLFTAFTVADEVLKSFTGVFKNLPFIGGFFSNLEDGEGIMDLFNSSADRAAKKLEKLSESAEKTNAALQASQALEKTQNDIRELSIKGQSRSAAEDLKLIELQRTEIKQLSELSQKISKVNVQTGDNAKITSLVNELKNNEVKSIESTTKALQELSFEREIQSFFQSARTKFLEDSEDTKRVDVVDGKRILSKELKAEIAGLVKQTSNILQTLDPERRDKIKGQLKTASLENDLSGVDMVRGLSKDLKTPVAQGYFAHLLKKLNDKQEKQNNEKDKQLQADQNLEAEIKKTVFAQKSKREDAEFSAKIKAKEADMLEKEQSLLRDILSEYGGILNSVKIQKDSAANLAKIQDDYSNKVLSINNKAINQAEDELNKKFTDNQKSISEQLAGKTFKAKGDLGLTEVDAKVLNELNKTIQEEKSTAEQRLMVQKADLSVRQKLAFAFAANGERQTGLTAKELEKYKQILKNRDNALELEEQSKKAQEQSVKQEKIRALISKKTVEGAFELQEILAKATPHAEVAIEAMRGNAATLKVTNDFREEDLQKILESSALIDEANQTQREKNATDTLAAKKSLEQLNYQIQNFQKNKQLRELNFKSEVAAQNLSSKELKERNEVHSKTKEYKDLIENKLKDEIQQAGIAERDAQLKNNFYNIEKNRIDLVAKQTNAEILNLNTTNLINQEKIKQLAEQGKITRLVAAQINQSKISATGDLQVAREKFQQTGSPEDAKALAEAMTALNLEFQNGSRAADALRERMAEMSVNAANLGADLVNIGFDNARSGLKDLFKSIGSGAKSASEAWSDFGLGLAESLLDRIMEHNIDKIMSNLSFAFTGQDLLKDSNMLLKESNVMLKGSNEILKGSNQALNSSNQALNSSNQALNSSNQVLNSSNQALNSSNQALNLSNAALLNSNMTLVAAINANTLALNAGNTLMPVQEFAKGGFVTGPAGVDKVPAMLTAGEYVVPKEEAQKFNNGTGQKGAQQKSRVGRGAEGITQMVVMNEVAKFVAEAMKDKDTSSPPAFDKNKFKNLDLRSDVNISRGDPRLSSRFLARDPVMQEYKDFLLEKAAYETQKTNEKFKKRQNRIASIVQMVGATATSALVAAASPYIKKGIQWAKDKTVNTAMGHSGLGKHSEAFKAARNSGQNVNYSDVKNHVETGDPLKFNDQKYRWMPQPDGGNAWEKMNSSAKPKSHRDIMGGQKFGIDTKNADILDTITGRRSKPRTLTRQSGGSVPAMLTAGEGFVPSSLAKKIGYENLNRMNKTGEMPIIQGPGGIDNVGPVGLTEGDFIIKKSSTDKLLRENPAMMKFALQNPGGFKRGETGYYDGGMVSSSPVRTSPSMPAKGSGPVNRLSASDPAEMLNQTSFQGSPATKDNDATQKRATTNNINVNVTIDQSGQEKVSTDGSSGSYEKEQELSMKIKSAVLEVIRNEKRIGGELSS